MSHVLPVHIICEIERRWRRRLDVRPRASTGKNIDRGAGSCPPCQTVTLADSAAPSDALSIGDDACGHAGLDESP